MTTTVTAFVEKVFANEREGRTGPYTLYSFKVQDAETGKVDPLYYNCGFDDPKVKEGEYIRFNASPNPKSSKGLDVDVSSIRVSQKPPARPTNPEPAPARGGRGGGGGYKKDPKVQRAISYQAARKDALYLVEILLENEGLPVIGTTGKAAKAKRYDEITAYVDKLTVRLFNDTETLRLLESVDDEGALKEPPAADPAEKLDEQAEARESDGDDGGFDDDGF